MAIRQLLCLVFSKLNPVRKVATIEEIQKIREYPDRRIKGIVYTMASSGIRLGAWDYIHWKHLQPIKREGTAVAAKIVVYAGDDEEYFLFITW